MSVRPCGLLVMCLWLLWILAFSKLDFGVQMKTCCCLRVDIRDDCEFIHKGTFLILLSFVILNSTFYLKGPFILSFLVDKSRQSRCDQFWIAPAPAFSQNVMFLKRWRKIDFLKVPLHPFSGLRKSFHPRVKWSILARFIIAKPQQNSRKQRI